MLKRGFLSSYAMAALMLLGTSISYLFIAFIRRGTSTFAPLSAGVSASRIVLLCLSLIVIPLVPAVLISMRDPSHFGVSGMIRWVIVGALIGAVGGILSEILPSAGQSSPLILGLAMFVFRIIIGLAVILSSYWLVFRLPAVASRAFGRRQG